MAGEYSIDHTKRPIALQRIFQRIDGWLQEFGMEQVVQKNSHAYRVGGLAVPNPLCTVQYMDTKGEPYVEFRYFRNVLEAIAAWEGFSTKWERIEGWAEAPDFVAEVSATGEYKMKFGAETMHDVNRVLKLISPMMQEAFR